MIDYPKIGYHLYENTHQEHLNQDFSTACRNGELALAQELLKQGANLENVHKGYHGIVVAGAEGHLHVVEYLLNSPETKKASFKHLEYALLASMRQQQYSIVDYMVFHPDFNATPRFMKEVNRTFNDWPHMRDYFFTVLEKRNFYHSLNENLENKDNKIVNKI